ncbi:pantoate/beta-alanine ligase [Denitrovibrio acetiphilus DSM 12809]|uniref:Pantothenate synthetase n=1 Tax=Denitrovibrio acetiphilus (strain DSM 12809 / NBRC 114555 / N2460) TaxID=522772 RepID=D4H851_DENA2|nr:pantoate--beta-alanine ligase [Denitrovibrio acetiphilus]ADD68200.1 pantoate/beta-alanine ligase [Denitrovibrio acetiphilus DSM 12809]
MKILNTVNDVKTAIKELQKAGRKVGLVPTMGFLHAGHMSLVKKSVADNDFTVVSVFVNPTQFGPNEDLEAYPRDFENDTKLLTDAGADLIFSPSPEEMYPEGFSTKVSVSGITNALCGLSRPVHFDGVATVVTKLFNIVNPDRAYFGSKDYQQLQVIRRMVKDLNMSVEVIGMPIIRESDGLAMSSRNIYLKPEERTSALSLSKSFGLIQKLLDNGERDARVLRQKVVDYINSHSSAHVDYVEIIHPEKLNSLETVNGDIVAALAVKIGRARLIDNKLFKI